MHPEAASAPLMGISSFRLAYGTRSGASTSANALLPLVDEATGYQAIRPQQALQAYLEKIIRKN
jgi:hypothetical protein